MCCSITEDKWMCKFCKVHMLFPPKLWDGRRSSSFFRSSEYKSQDFFSSSCSLMTRRRSATLTSNAKVPSQQKIYINASENRDFHIIQKLVLQYIQTHQSEHFSLAKNCKISSSSDGLTRFSSQLEVLKLLRRFCISRIIIATFWLSCPVWHDVLIVIWDVPVTMVTEVLVSFAFSCHFNADKLR